MLLLGCDFSSAPTRRKPIVVATGSLDESGRVLRLDELIRFPTLDGWGDWLAARSAWIGAFDFPFSLPRELVEHLGWPKTWRELIAHYAALERSEIRRLFAAFCAGRPTGSKFAHRAADGPAGSSPSMKWVNPPVAYMLHAGVPRVVAAGAVFPGLHAPEACFADRVALEGYPGLLARELIGRRSYKSDDKARQTEERRAARVELAASLARGDTRLGLSLDATGAQTQVLLDDATGDAIDAVLCLFQAAWGSLRGAPHFGLPADIDPLEGWIVTA